MYQAPAPGGALEQGDILDDCPVFLLDEAGLLADPSNVQASCLLSRVVVITQSCDLAQAKVDRAVVAPIHVADDLVSRGLLKAQVIRDQIRRGVVFGWYYLPRADAPIDLPESLIELRDLHTLPLTVLNALVASGKRVARLATPFREHMAQHFAVTYMRIGLPGPPPTAP